MHPEQIKSQQGTLEYRFSKDDIETFKAREALKAEQTGQDETGQSRQDAQNKQSEENSDGTERTDRTRETGHKEHIYRGATTENAKDPAIKGQPEQTGQDTPDKTRHNTARETGQDGEIITLLKETTGFLKEQLKVKDEQIKDLGGKIDQLIERDRETNILLRGLQDKILALEPPKETAHINEETTHINATEPEQTGHHAKSEGKAYTASVTENNNNKEKQGQPEETGQDTAEEIEHNKPKPDEA